VHGSEYDHGYLWQDGGMYDLNSLLVAEDAGWTVEYANDINDNGWIVATGWNPAVNGGAVQALLLIPTPEPAPFLLLVVGSLGLLPRRRY